MLFNVIAGEVNVINDDDYGNYMNELFFTASELSFCNLLNNLYYDADNDTTIVSNNIIDTNAIPFNHEGKITNVKNDSIISKSTDDNIIKNSRKLPILWNLLSKQFTVNVTTIGGRW